jgi:phosphatidylserine decarboxylase
VDTANPLASAQETLHRLSNYASNTPEEEGQEDLDLAKAYTYPLDGSEEDDEFLDLEAAENDAMARDDGAAEPELVEKLAEKRKRNQRLRRLKKKSKHRAYEFTGGSDCV